MHEWLQDFRISLRALRRDRAYALAALLSLAVGIGGVTTAFSIVQTVLLRPSPFPDAERLYVVRQSVPEAGSRITIAPYLYEGLRQAGRGIEELSALDRVFFHLSTGGEPERVEGAQVSAGFFRTLGAEPVLGRSFTAEEETPGQNRVAVLSYGLWQRRFGGDADVLGREIEVDAVQSFGPDREIPQRLTVVGVLGREFRLPLGSIDVWVPLAPSREGANWRFSLLFLVARLSSDAPIEQSLADLNAAFQSLAFDDALPAENRTLDLVPLTAIGVADVRSALLLLWAASVLVLLIACANVAHLLLGRVSSRRGELATRVVMGAARASLVRLLLIESLWLAAAGAVLGLVLSEAMLRLVRAFGPAGTPRLAEVALEPRVLAFSFLLVLLTVSLTGSIPAWRGSRLDAGQALRGTSHAPAHRRSPLGLRGALIALETALALVLLISATLVAKSLHRLREVEPGYRPENVVTFRAHLPTARYPERAGRDEALRRLLERFASVPGVASAGAINHLPLGNVHTVMLYRVEGEGDAGVSRRASFRLVSEGYLETMGIPLLRGRLFDEQDVSERPRVVVVNRKLAAEGWPEKNPLGERLVLQAWGGASFEVVGVVGDVHQRGLSREAEPTLYLPRLPSPAAAFVVRTAADPSSTLDVLKREAAEVDPLLPLFDVSTLSQSLSGSLEQERFQTTLMIGFSATALLLAIIGVYGVMAHSVVRRRYEIGIRMAIGARRADVVKLILGQASVPMLLGTTLGWVAALLLGRVLESMLFGVSARDPAVFLAAAFVLAVVAMGAAWAPARRAARVDPMGVLRAQ